MNEKGHGRVEERSYVVSPIPVHLRVLVKNWPGIRSIGQSITMVTKGDKHTAEVRYYISCRWTKISEFANSVRKHCGIESMHWILDVVFNEDGSRIH